MQQDTVATKERFTVNIDADQFERRQRLAERNSASMAWLGRQAIARFLSEHGPQSELPFPPVHVAPAAAGPVYMIGSFYKFFAGGGMAPAGLGDRWSCLFANVVDRKKSRNLPAWPNWRDDTMLCDDIRRITTTRLPGAADPAWASSPCQDLSLAGAGAGLRGARSGTFWPFW